jgi:site-specific recombinase XerD
MILAEGCFGAAGKQRFVGQSAPHVLRHTFASVAGDLGFAELTIAGLLGHSAHGVT